jgi:hypothetical protein
MLHEKSLKSLCAGVVVLATLTLMLATIPPGHAAEGGSSHYGPGLYGDFGAAVAPPPGFYLRSDVYFYMADAAKERFVQLGQLRANLEVDVGMYMVTGLVALDKEVLGGRYVFGALLPVTYTDLSADITLGSVTEYIDEDRTTIADMGIIPVSLFWNSGEYHFNLYESISVPTGTYALDRNVNGGLNYWTFDTVLAATYLMEDRGHEISAALGYAYNTKNDDTDYKSGQEIHVDYMLNQYMSETFGVGLQGFYLNQITGDSGSGAILGDFKGEAAGIGPALMWTPSFGASAVTITAKWLHEFHAEHRLEGDHLFVSFTLAL